MTAYSDTVAPAEAAAVNVYQAIGGRAAVAAAVEGLYGRLLADPVLSRFFPGGDADFDRTAAHLAGTLDGLGVPGHLADHIVGVVAGLRPALVTA